MKKFIIPLVALTTFLGCRSVQVMNTKPVRVTVENQPIAVDVKNFPPAQGQASNVIVTNPVKILSNKIPYFDILIDNNQRVAPRKPGRRLWITFASTTKYSGGAAPYQPSTANISLNTNIDKLPPAVFYINGSSTLNILVDQGMYLSFAGNFPIYISGYEEEIEN